MATTPDLEPPPASSALHRLGIPHEVFRHAGQVSSLEQAARERGQREEQVVRSILFRLGEARFVMVLVAGPAQISWKKLREHLAQSRLSMASAGEVLRVTGYEIGAVSPFGLSNPLPVLIDAGVLGEELISIGSGAPKIAIVMRSVDVKRALPDAQLCQLRGDP
jgi:Cys-tRNA(Pro)/Cys-tRNA(Cys) deacylase